MLSDEHRRVGIKVLCLLGVVQGQEECMLVRVRLSETHCRTMGLVQGQDASANGCHILC